MSFWSPQLWVRDLSSAVLGSSSSQRGAELARISASTSWPELATASSRRSLDVVFPNVSPIWYLNWGQKPPYLKKKLTRSHFVHTCLIKPLFIKEFLKCHNMKQVFKVPRAGVRDHLGKLNGGAFVRGMIHHSLSKLQQKVIFTKFLYGSKI